MATALPATLAAALVGAALLGAPAANASEPVDIPDNPALAQATMQADDLPSEQSDAQRDLREAAVTNLVGGETQVTTVNGKKVLYVKGAKGCPGRYVQYDVNRRASVFTVLVEFGDAVAPTTGGEPGPLHNKIAAPDRTWDGGTTDDNSTAWKADYDRAHYLDLMFGQGESFKSYYKAQSQGRFEVTGDVTDWVKVPFNEARYGSNKVKGAAGYWPFVEDTAKAWYDAQKAAGKTDAEIKAYLAQFDKWDRYDFDKDGNFEEPDGYIDHFQAIHAGEGEEAGGGAQGEDAIWSHRWYAYSLDKGKKGPAGNLNGGVQIGDTGMWIGDYTTEPENGGLGVFVHEFGHDLGLPDLYDTTNKASNGTAYWTLMSSGSWLSAQGPALGTNPGNLGAWEKQQLGWLDYATTTVGKPKMAELSPASVDERRNVQALAVALPDQQVTGTLNRPFIGKEWWSGTGNNLDASLAKTVDLTAAKTDAKVTAYTQYDTEKGHDLFTAEVSTDGGRTWTVIGSPRSGTDNVWRKIEVDLTPYLGKVVEFRWHYAADAAVNRLGVFLDSMYVIVDGRFVNSDGGDEPSTEWTAKGFTVIDGTGTYPVGHYYLVENRQYVGYDKYLRTGPYNFGWQPDKEAGTEGRPNWVERFPYQEGMLVWYVNDAYKDNNVSTHPGYGRALPVDAHPAPLTWGTGQVMANRIQSYDATFSWRRTDPLELHRFGVPTKVKGQWGQAAFHDSTPDAYYRDGEGIRYNSTRTAGSGVKVTILGQVFDHMTVLVTYPRK